jgi:hypothetical protein
MFAIAARDSTLLHKKTAADNTGQALRCDHGGPGLLDRGYAPLRTSPWRGPGSGPRNSSKKHRRPVQTQRPGQSGRGEKYEKNPRCPGPALYYAPKRGHARGPDSVPSKNHKNLRKLQKIVLLLQKTVLWGDARCAPVVPHCRMQWTPTERGNTVEKYGLSVTELEAQHVELLPDRIEMRRRRRRIVQDCDSVLTNSGTFVVVTPTGAFASTTCVIA